MVQRNIQQMIGHTILMEGLAPRRHLHRNLSSYHRRPLPLARLGSLHGTCPRFVVNYHGWSCPPLAMFYGGVAHAAYVLGSTQTTPVPHPRRSDRTDMAILRADLSTWPLLLVSPVSSPRWYRRAVKAGVPRNDPKAMGAFKALPLEQQREAAQQGNQR